MREKRTLRESMQTKILNPPNSEKLTEEKHDVRSETSSESIESIHHLKKKKRKLKKKQTLYGNSNDKREKERIYDQYRITDNNNATGRRNSKNNQKTENYKQILRCKQKRSRIPGKISGEYRIRK